MKTILGDIYFTVLGAIHLRWKFPDRKKRQAFMAKEFDSKLEAYGAHVFGEMIKKMLLLFVAMVLVALVVAIVFG